MKYIPIKTQSEIELMRQGGRILKLVLDEVEKAIRPGIKTLELDQLAEKLIIKSKGIPSFKGYGANKKTAGFPGTLCVSVNDEVVHGIPGDYIIRDGDIVAIDCGVFYQGFHTDSARTILVGNVLQNIEHFVKTTQKALQKALQKVKSGVPLGDVSNVIQKTMEQRGYAVVRNCTGHGIGRALHEPPEILNYGKKGQGIVLQSGMTLAIEPISVMGECGDTYDASDGWTVKTSSGELSAHFEHTVLVTDSGYEILA